MSSTLQIADFLGADDHLILDVRSPLEYDKGHIPKAINFPLFTNEERARVGTCYKERGREEAMILGLDLVGPKMGSFLREARKLNPERRPFRVHCFRGGQRSQSLGWLLEKGGYSVSLLEGGYKAYRRHVLESFAEPQVIVILSGCTGSGKTRLLHALAEQGEQMIDLESLACHRGSAFGGYHQPADLTTEMFQNQMHRVWSTLKRDVRVWVEDEGPKLGGLVVPEPFSEQARNAPVLFLDIPQEPRAELLAEEYGEYSHELLQVSIDKIAKRLGPDIHKRCLASLDDGDHFEVARLCLSYYDRAYLHSLSRRAPDPFWTLQLPSVDTADNLREVLGFLRRQSSEEACETSRIPEATYSASV